MTSAKQLFENAGGPPTLEALVFGILSKLSEPSDRSWMDKESYGLLLADMRSGKESTQREISLLYGVQRFYHDNGFPKNEKGEPIMQSVFFQLYNKDIVEEDGFQEWRDDENDSIPGKTKALVQVTDFFTWLNDAEEEQSEEDED